MNVVLTWRGTFLRLSPESVSISSGAESAKLNTLGLSKLPILLNFGQTLADRGIIWIIDIDIAARTWVRCFNLFVAGSIVTGAKRNSYGFFLQESLLDVILLLPTVVVTRTWIFLVSLTGERRINLILPHIGAACTRIERIILRHGRCVIRRVSRANH